MEDTFKLMSFAEIKLDNSDLPIEIKKKPIRADELKFVDLFPNKLQIKYALVRRQKFPCQKCDVVRAGFITKDSFGVEFIDGDTFDIFLSKWNCVTEKDVAMGESSLVLVDDSDGNYWFFRSGQYVFAYKSDGAQLIDAELDE
jgi:hypothetical protein